jgi:hypothetical protein
MAGAGSREALMCYCEAYHFPHRAGGGRCRSEGEIELCSACRQPFEGREYDFGIGVYEYWGQMREDVNVQVVSKCCLAPATSNQPEKGN